MATSSLDISKFRQQLEQMRDELQAEIDRLQEENASGDQDEGYGVTNHPAEDASDMFSRERNLAVSSDLQTELSEIERALERVEAGTYGRLDDFFPNDSALIWILHLATSTEFNDT